MQGAGNQTETALKSLLAVEQRRDRLWIEEAYRLAHARFKLRMIAYYTDELANAPPKIRDVAAKAQQDIDILGQCLPRIKDALASQKQGVVSAWEEAAASSRAATQALLNANSELRPQLLKMSDTARRRRHDAEIAATGEREKFGASQCAEAAGAASASVAELRRLQADATSSIDALRTRWLAMQDDLAFVARARQMAPPAPVPPALDRLFATSAAVKPVPVLEPSDPRPLADLQEAARAVEQLPEQAQREEDAAVFIAWQRDRLAGGVTRRCQSEACWGLDIDRQTLVWRAQRSREEYGTALRDLTRGAAAWELQTQRLQADLNGLNRWRADWQGVVDPLLRAALEARWVVMEAVRRQIEELEAAITAVEAQLRSDAERWHAMLGRGALAPWRRPDWGASQGRASDMLIRPTPTLRGHAYQLLSRWDGEADGFGAYTYVFVRRAADLRHPSVLRRYRLVLESLLSQAEANSVSGRDLPNTNVFCVPVNLAAAPVRSSSDIADAYHETLARQLVVRAPPGLLSRPEIARRLNVSHGPFLITLPRRMSQSESTTPILFADLSGYGESAITDLVGQYLGDLLSDFGSAQASWRPPVRQRVALAMISIQADTVHMVANLVPIAQRSPGRAR